MSKIDELEVALEDGSKFMLTTKWLRHTQNPIAPKYPKTGDVIILKKDYSFFLVAGKPYTVSMVEEYEPAYTKDEDGRDIRLSFLECDHKMLNGKAIIELL